MSHSCAVVIPVYRKVLEPLEEFSLDYSLEKLTGRDAFFVGPRSLDLSYYTARYPNVKVMLFDDEYFVSIKGYNKLLLDPAFYEKFSTHEFMLILQTDAIVLKDELDHWCAAPYDYVGAPWPDPLEIMINLDVFTGVAGKKVKTQVGNGGLSLRRNRKCIALIAEFPEATQMFLRSGSSEDIFFSLMGSQSLEFVIPNDRVAGRFSLEVRPEFYFALNGNRAPMGGHAWWQQMPFWMQFLDRQPPVLLDAQPARRVALNVNSPA
ncbi:MAG: DUF5672 family protein [Verrucomicrobiota bacterium]